MASFIDGHADVWSLFTDGSFLRELVAGSPNSTPTEPLPKWQGSRPEASSSAAAIDLGVGFVAIRKEAGLFPGEKLALRTPADYRGNASLLRIQRGAVVNCDRILLVDDWIETGVQALTAKELIVEAGGDFVGASVVVDETSREVRAELAHFSALLSQELVQAGLT
jgi:adenine phosphoribosyltransferase